ncbi:MAG: hypothetical protein WDN23_00920 [Edaphobacter sp.]
MDEFQKFRLDVIQALAALDVEIDTLRKAVQENGVSAKHLDELRSGSQQRFGRFVDSHAQKIEMISRILPAR